jgi:antitoxin component YwqK of YwqJK toxin-antitoxin module
MKYIMIFPLLWGLVFQASAQLHEVFAGEKINKIDQLGKLQETWFFFDENNQLVMQADYRDSKPYGKVKYYYKSAVYYEVTYFKDEDGYAFHFLKNGLSGTKKFVQGRPVYQYDDGRPVPSKDIGLLHIKVPAAPVGGKEAVDKYFDQSITKRARKDADNIKFSFTVMSNGKIDEVSIEKGLSSLSEAKLLDIIMEMPRWRAETNMGIPEKSRITWVHNFDN